MRSLIVDDDELGRMLLTTFFEDFGHCDQAENGQVALDLYEAAVAEENPYDLICLDIVMPVMDGMTTLRNLREIEQQQKRKRTMVFVISACNSISDIEDAFFEGDCDDYIVKPFSRESVRQMLARHKMILPE